MLRPPGGDGGGYRPVHGRGGGPVGYARDLTALERGDPPARVEATPPPWLWRHRPERRVWWR